MKRAKTTGRLNEKTAGEAGTKSEHDREQPQAGAPPASMPDPKQDTKQKQAKRDEERKVGSETFQPTNYPPHVLSGFIPRITEFELASGGKISVESYRVMAVISGEESPEPGKPERCRLILHSGASFTVIGNGDEVRKDFGHC